jgi:hypothetical protein
MSQYGNAHFTARITCKDCMRSIPRGTLPSKHSRLQVSVLADGTIEVWCTRHDKLVMHLSQTGVRQLAKQPCFACGHPHETPQPRCNCLGSSHRDDCPHWVLPV